MLVHGKPDEVLVDFSVYRSPQIVGIGLTQHAERPWRRHNDK